MTPDAFIGKWKNNALSERAGAQQYFLDLCDVLGVAKPDDSENYCFERGATRTGAGRGWADVWKRNCFAWENKGPGGDMSKALKQLMTYALALDNPPLLVVCNRALIEIHTHYTGTPSEIHTIRLDDIGLPESLQTLRWVFTAPDKFRPDRTLLDVTSEAAGYFADLAQSISSRGHPPEKVAHFLIQCLFSMFAEDAGLLPAKLFQRIVAKSSNSPEKLAARLGDLFQSMRAGGDFMLEDIAWFNGGLFEVVEPVPLVASEAKALLTASDMDWSHIEPSIFGTMFERGLDPAMRSQLGANYTDPGTIEKIINPVIVRPLADEWETAKATIAKLMVKYRAGGKGSQSAYKTAQETFLRFIELLKNFRVLDPACGSGNFLYLALRALKDLEHRANLDAEALGLQRQLTIETNPANMLGLEINAYAAELARVTIWIGEIQWMLKNGYDIQRRPILAALKHIECRDAVVKEDGTEAEWPRADVIIGNPPFLGNKKMLGELGEGYVKTLRKLYKGRVPGSADLVNYWFEKARAHIAVGNASIAGLVATQSIRKGSNRAVLDRIFAAMPIFEAWRDEPWVNDGAAVRVSIVGFGNGGAPRIDGQAVSGIHPDLTPASAGMNITQAKPLADNVNVIYQGTIKVGSFDIPGDIARNWLKLPNPNGQPNADVLRPWANGQDLTGRPSDTWVIDFGTHMKEPDAALYEVPFAHVLREVKPYRDTVRRAGHRNYWWRHAEARPGMRRAMGGLARYVATPRVAKHRFFVWLPVSVLPDSRLYAICRDDDFTFGVLSSRIHEVWSLANASRHGVGNDPTYNAVDCFETFPFPHPSRDVRAAVEREAQLLDALRRNWLNPVEWVIRMPDVLPGLPDRLVAKVGHEHDLNTRTLTELYNLRPAWLLKANEALNDVVAIAYGWTDYTPEMPDEEILRRLLALNLSRTAALSDQAKASVRTN